MERIDAARQRRGAKHPSTLMQEVIWSVSGIYEFDMGSGVAADDDDDDDDDGMLHAFSKSVIDKLECGFASIVCHVIGTHVPPDPKHWGASFGVFCSIGAFVRVVFMFICFSQVRQMQACFSCGLTYRLFGLVAGCFGSSQNPSHEVMSLGVQGRPC